MYERPLGMAVEQAATHMMELSRKDARIAELEGALTMFLRCVDNGYFGNRGLKKSPVVAELRSTLNNKK
jgi:hypothetical protein